MSGLAYVGSLGVFAGSGTTVTVTVTKAAPVGALVTVSGTGNNGNLATTVSDSRGNVYTTVLTPNSGAPVVLGYVATSTLTAALRVGDVITISHGVAVSKQANLVDAWTGLADAPADKAVQSAGNGGAPTAGATGTLAQADELLIVFAGTAQQAAEVTSLGGYALASQAASTSGTNDRRMTTFWTESSATGSTTPALAAVPSTWSVALRTFKVAASTPPASGPAAYVWDGSSWVQKTSVAVWDGSSWVAKATLTVL